MYLCIRVSRWLEPSFQSEHRVRMARGQQKIQSQQKAAEKAAKLKKAVSIHLTQPLLIKSLKQKCLPIHLMLFNPIHSNPIQFTPQAGNSKHDNAKTAAAGLKCICVVCK